MKRTLALILALMLLVSGAAFAEELTLKVANSDLFPVTTEAGAELTVFTRQVASIEDLETNLETIAMEKLTDVTSTGRSRTRPTWTPNLTCPSRRASIRIFTCGISTAPTSPPTRRTAW